MNYLHGNVQHSVECLVYQILETGKRASPLVSVIVEADFQERVRVWPKMWKSKKEKIIIKCIFHEQIKECNIL